jgi:hypothetical protein
VSNPICWTYAPVISASRVGKCRYSVAIPTPALGRKHRHSPAKAERLLGWHARPGRETVADCGESLLATKAVQLS